MKRALWVLFALIAISSISWADVLDFTNSNLYGSMTGNNSATVGLWGDPNAIQITAAPSWAKLTQTSGVGLGIKSFLDPFPGQINDPEFLTVSFDKPTYLKDFTVSQLYNVYVELGNVVKFKLYTEDGAFNADNDGWVSFSGSDSGVQTVQVNNAVSKVVFAADTPVFDSFSLASMTVTPEPASVVLLGTVLLGCGAILRRRLARG